MPNSTVATLYKAIRDLNRASKPLEFSFSSRPCKSRVQYQLWCNKVPLSTYLFSADMEQQIQTIISLIQLEDS